VYDREPKCVTRKKNPLCPRFFGQSSGRLARTGRGEGAGGWLVKNFRRARAAGHALRRALCPTRPGFTIDAQSFLRNNKDSLTPEQQKNLAAINDCKHTAQNGVYDPRLDPRPINAEYEAAILEDWRRMGSNSASKGNSFTFMVGSFLTEKGMLGAIDQTLWGANGPPPLQFDGLEGSRQREACGSFFDPGNYLAGVESIGGMGRFHGHHLFTVGDHQLTCSWDEVGLRTLAQMDYRDPIRAEFGKYAVAKITGSRERQVTKEFQRLQCDYLFENQLCLVRRANQRGSIEGFEDFGRVCDGTGDHRCGRNPRDRGAPPEVAQAADDVERVREGRLPGGGAAAQGRPSPASLGRERRDRHPQPPTGAPAG